MIWHALDCTPLNLVVYHGLRENMKSTACSQPMDLNYCDPRPGGDLWTSCDSIFWWGPYYILHHKMHRLIIYNCANSWWYCTSCRHFICGVLLQIYSRRCKTSLVGQSTRLTVLRLPFRFRQNSKIENSKIQIWVHRTSNKVTRLFLTKYLQQHQQHFWQGVFLNAVRLTCVAQPEFHASSTICV